MENILSKVCKKCGIDKPLDCFHNHKRQLDGKKPVCKECRKAETKAYIEQNREKIRESNKAYYENNKEKCLARFAEYRKNNSEAIKQRDLDYRQKHKEELRIKARERWAKNTEKNKAYREKNAEKRRAYTRRWLAENKERRAQFLLENKERMNAAARAAYHANPARQYEASRRYIEKNRDKVRASQRNWTRKSSEKARAKYGRRRAARRMLPSTLLPCQWLDCLSIFENKCAYCGQSHDVLHQEHVIPQNSGGGYVKENIVPACKSCNSSKSDTPMISWYVRRKYFDSQRLEKILNYLYGDFNATHRTVEAPPFPVNRQPPRESIF